ncbi:MAG: outer membrane lipoprotein carrier protein LolA [Nitrospinota bacterium]
MGKIAFIAAFLIAVQPLYAAETGKEEIINKVETRFASMKNFTASFRQKQFDASLGETEISGGSVTMQKPLKMRWEYIEPQKQTVVSDGKSIYFYVPADRQVMVEPLGNVLTSRSPALFLSGSYKLSEIFRIELEPAGDKDRMKGDIKLSLVPKEKSLSVTRIVLSVKSGDFTISAFTLYDWTGNRTEIEFTEMKINGRINEAVFNFNRPAGVEIMEMPRLDYGTE